VGVGVENFTLMTFCYVYVDVWVWLWKFFREIYKDFALVGLELTREGLGYLTHVSLV